MSKIISLHVQGFRNLTDCSLFPHQQFNLFEGPNGAGKTALLESIYFLSRSRSFRSAHIQACIQQGKGESLVVAKVQGDDAMSRVIGSEQHRKKSLRLHEEGAAVHSRTDRALRMPVQLLTPDSFRQWIAKPSARRSFLDWGVFHVEPNYAAAWRTYSRTLVQRNALLKKSPSEQILKPWDFLLEEQAKILHHHRQIYWDEFYSAFQALWAEWQNMFLFPSVEASFLKGWHNEEALSSILASQRRLELSKGHTCAGPHRADLDFRSEGVPCLQIFSRGQMKLLLCALLITQIRVLEAKEQEQAILLYDDLACELDKNARKCILGSLQKLSQQVFLTGLEGNALADHLPSNSLAQFQIFSGKVLIETA